MSSGAQSLHAAIKASSQGQRSRSIPTLIQLPEQTKTHYQFTFYHASQCLSNSQWIDNLQETTLRHTHHCQKYCMAHFEKQFLLSINERQTILLSRPVLLLAFLRHSTELVRFRDDKEVGKIVVHLLRLCFLHLFAETSKTNCCCCSKTGDMQWFKYLSLLCDSKYCG